jgi:hypothetical protein
MGSNIPYSRKHRPITSTLTTDEYEELKVIADAAGLQPTPYATKIIREELARKREEVK